MKTTLGKVIFEIGAVLEWVGLSLQGRREEWRGPWGGF